MDTLGFLVSPAKGFQIRTAKNENVFSMCAGGKEHTRSWIIDSMPVVINKGPPKPAQQNLIQNQAEGIIKTACIIKQHIK